VIVPMGSKGGFVVKNKTASRQEYLKEGVECYKIFIRGLLDITDNLSGTKVIPPKDVVRRDGDDPYLVVAADKGTATFSDTANGLSQEYGFWLDDAFASGGSAGYDHKKMGITARGAWECVRSHFQHLNHNIQEKPFDVIGIGDMGGDVFGNGMLLSEHIRLVGAFNHVHIFCDPNPDCASSFKERKRLFNGVMGWDEYDTKKLSPGGRIFSRSEKSLQLTPEIQKRFDIAESKVAPNDLIRAILKARTDLLWFGGIGTYLKASYETHEQVGDKANDGLRVNANEIRAKVIGEGANMAVTQRARIQFSENGGRLNTDFLDNSGGVDSSDHEVNIKILLSDVMRSKDNKMDLKARNKLLGQMTDEIAAHVLRNNYQQTQAISLAEMQARDTLAAQEELIQALEREQGLDREIEGLPSREIIEERIRTGKGMTRPELCILLSYAKIKFTKELLATDIPDDPHLRPWLMDYFPEVLQKRYEKQILRHRLAREIIAMRLASSVINRMGPTFVQSCMKKTGASIPEIARACIIVRESFELKNLWNEIESLDDKTLKQVQLKAHEEASRMIDHTVAWFLTRTGRPLLVSRDIKDYKNGVQLLRKNMHLVLPDDVRKTIEKRAEYSVQDGLPKALALNIAQMPVLSSACDIIRISLERKTDIQKAAAVYFRLGSEFHLDWLRQQARFMNSEDRWHAEAKAGLIDQLYSAQAGLTVKILQDTAKHKAKAKELVDIWIGMNQEAITQLEPFFAEIRRAGTVDLPMLIAAEQRLRSLYAV
jgi:glutamate dehydrogenase